MERVLTFPRRVFAARPRADRWTIGRSRGAAAPLAGAIAAAAKRVAWVRAITVPAVVGVLFLAVRYWLARTPVLSETYYDEALTGLMGLAILRGVPQVFYWGEPYGGAIGDAYLAAAGFWVFGPSTLVLRMSAIVVIILWAWAVWSIARRIGGEGCGWLAGLYIAVPPVFLSYVQLSSQGEGAQVITFESGERITCADYYGFRNFSFLQMVDAVDDPETVAIVTHHVLQNPPPEVMAATLRLSGAEVQRDEVGDYVIFHHIRPPDPRVHPIPSSRWSARASTRSEAAPLAVDRRVWTRWATSEGGAVWFELDLGRAYRLAQITLASTALDAPASMHVETSPDGRVWDTAAMASDILPGLHWWKGHPRVDESGRTLVRIEPRLARFVRITAQSRPGAPWSLNELFAYEGSERRRGHRSGQSARASAVISS